MKTNHRLLGACAAVGMLALPGILGCPGAARADTLELKGILRDFHDTHPDFETAEYLGGYGVCQGMVTDTLGEDGNPVYNSVRPRKDTMTSRKHFDQWYRNVPGVNTPMQYTLRLSNGKSKPGGVYSVAYVDDHQFFPLDDKLFGNEGRVHNYHFTFELHTKFTYTDPQKRDYPLTFSFVGDDDVYVYINGKKVVDIGGVHQQAPGSVNVDEVADQLHLVPGQTYPFDFFFAERHTTQSNFRFQTTLQLSSLDPLYD